MVTAHTKLNIYLAGPMSGLPEHNFPAFNEAAKLLRDDGHTVFNPAENNSGKEFNEYMAIDLPQVCKATSVVFLPDWIKSRGACLEYFVADYLGKFIFGFQKSSEVSGNGSYCSGYRLFNILRKPFVFATEAALMIEREGLKKHVGDNWYSEPRQNHTLKAGRHLMTHELISGGFSKEDGEDHLGNALCRVAMALAQEPSPPNRSWWKE